MLLWEVRHAARSLRRRPTFTLITTFLLSIGIGANTAVLSIIDTSFFRKIPSVSAPGQLVMIFSGDSASRAPAGDGFSFPEYRDLLGAAGLTGLGAYAITTLSIDDSSASARVTSAFVSGSYFLVLGVRPELGRLIRPDEEEPRGAHPVVVISDVLWRTRFARDPHVIGRTVTIGKANFEIVGVAPPRFTGMHPEGRTDLWVPFTMQAEATGSAYVYDNRSNRNAVVFGRSTREGRLAETQASLDRASRDLATRFPETNARIVYQVRRHERLVDQRGATGVLATFVFVWAMIALVHLVACSNVASLILARAVARRPQLALCRCLGATRTRIVTQSLTECAMLAALGAAGGIVIGRVLVTMLMGLRFLSAMEPGFDARVVGIVLLVTLGSAMQFGVLPALEVSRGDPLASVRGAVVGRAVTGSSRVAPAVLLVGQLALSLTLLAQAGVLVRAFAHATRVDAGIDVDHLLTTDLPLMACAPSGAWATAYGEAEARLAMLPGVTHVAAFGGLGLGGAGGLSEKIDLSGAACGHSVEASPQAEMVGPGYFATMGAAISGGREFTDADRAQSGSATRASFDVVVVNETLARRCWPSGDVLGKQLVIRGERPATVIGVVHDVHTTGAASAKMQAYFPLLEAPLRGVNFTVRTAGDPATLVPLVREVMTSLSNVSHPPTVRTLHEQRDGQLSLTRVGSVALTTCAGVALVLTAVGLYGLVATLSAERRSELGIRLALGANSSHIYRILLARTARMIAAGAAIGFVITAALVRAEHSWWGPEFALDPVTVAFVVLVFLVVATTATFIPALRATRVDPVEALRSS